jgi:hypothetical protein
MSKQRNAAEAGGWNYRMVRRHLRDGTTRIGIHEVFYDDEGKAERITEEPIGLENDADEGVPGLVAEIGSVLHAIAQPVLEYEIPARAAETDEVEDADDDADDPEFDKIMADARDARARRASAADADDRDPSNVLLRAGYLRGLASRTEGLGLSQEDREFLQRAARSLALYAETLTEPAR